MCLRNRPFIPSTPDFPSHPAVLDYIRRFEQDEKLSDLIQYDTNVIDAEYRDSQWWITSFSIATGNQTTESFDALVVANGHYYEPFVPDIDGLKHYKECEEQKSDGVKIIHSREYREPQEFTGKVSFDCKLCNCGNRPLTELCFMKEHSCCRKFSICK